MNTNYQKGIVKNIIVIIILLTIVFLSQQAFTQPIGKQIFSQISEKTGGYVAKVGDWLKTKINPDINKEVQDRGEKAQEELIKQKDGAVKSIWGNIKNYFAEKFSKIFGTKVE